MLNDPQRHFIRVVSRDLFFIYTISWFIGFMAELIKPGLVSNYVSLEKNSVFILIFAIFASIFAKNHYVSRNVRFNRNHVIILLILSVMMIGFITFFMNLSWFLTLLLIFGSLVALWIGSYEMMK